MKFLQILVFLFSFSVVTAQFTGSEYLEKELAESELKNIQSMTEIGKTDMTPIGNSVDARFYKVGPSDIFLLKILPQLSTEQVIIVNPESKIILPRAYGVVDTKSKTISQVRNEIDSIIKKISPKSNIVFELFKARLCLVTISGNVIKPGTYTIPASYRVSTAITLANQLKSEISSNPIESYGISRFKENLNDQNMTFSGSGIPSVSNYSNRNITIFHKNGESSFADIEKANINPDMVYLDPFISEGDIIDIPFDPNSYPKISVAGEVAKPISIVFKKGDMLSDLLRFAKGLKENADIDNIKLYRNSQKFAEIKVDANLNLLSNNIALLPGDAVIVPSLPKQFNNNNGYVAIRGLVNNEGVFPVIPNQTTVKDIMEMAGGFQAEAYLPLAKIYRRSATNKHYTDFKKEQYELYQNSDLTLEDTIRLNLDIQYLKPTVSCDFQELFVNNNESQNIVLQDGDLIVIPKKPRSIYVFGRVNKPGYIQFTDNKNLEWYINRAGGYSAAAEEDRTRIIRGANNVWIEADEKLAINDGDKIYVPGKPDIPLQAQDARTGMIASLVSAFTIMVNVIFNMANSN